MSTILKSLNAHNLPIFQPILMILVSKFMVHRVLSDKTYLLLGLLSPLIFYFKTLKRDISKIINSYESARKTRASWRHLLLQIDISHGVRRCNVVFTRERRNLYM